MRIAVCMKQVPGVSEGSMDPRTGVLIRTGLESVTNLYDRSALEAALQIREQQGGEIHVFTMGPGKAEEVLREAYAMGADQGYLISDRAFGGADVLATSYTLMQAIRSAGDYDLILCGRQTTDGDTAQTGSALAAWMGWQQLNWVTELKAEGDQITASCRMDEQTAEVTVSLPCVVMVERDGFLPRMPSLKLKMQGRKKAVRVISLAELSDSDPEHYGLRGSATRVKKIFAPRSAEKKELVYKNGAEGAAYILKALREPESCEPERKNSSGPEILSDHGDRKDSNGAKREKIPGWSGILVYLQCREGHMHPSGPELIGQACRLAAQSGDPVWALGIGSHMERLQEELAGYPVSHAFLYETDDVFEPCRYASLAVACIREQKPSVVLVGGTLEGRALAPRLSVEFRTGLTADCTELSMEADGNLVQTRPAFGGNVMASILTENSRPQFATVRPGVMEPAEKREGLSVPCSVQRVSAGAGSVKVREKEWEEKPVSIAGSSLLVAAGRGIKKKEDLKMLYRLAELLGGELACSRALVEKGWMPPKRQIGLSGNSVRPECLITFGISGTVQFMAGMKQAKRIIAVNSDPRARIFEIAHHPVCGDLYEIVPELIQCVEKEVSNQSGGI